jgi:hypothetical protein
VILPSSVYAQTGDLNIIPKTDVISAAYPRHGGWAVNPELQAAYVADAGAAVPANARAIGGWAFTDDGALYVTSDAVTGPFTWINGFKTRQDGALVVLNRAGVPATDPYPLGWAADGATGAALVGGATFVLPLSDAGAGAVNLTPFLARGSATPTFVRATDASTVGADGLVIKSVGSGVARSYYDPSSTVTNIALWSQEFNNGAWLGADRTVVQDAAVAPDGTWTGDKITDGALGTAFLSQSVTATADVIHTASRYFKRGNHDWVRLGIAGGANQVNGWFNLATGASAATVAGTGASATASMVDAGNGWYRCIISGNVGSGLTTITFYSSSATASGNGTRITDGYRYEWGAQFENNKSTVAAYVATTSAARSVAQTYLGYLAEGQRTNLLLSSEDLRSSGAGNPVAAWTNTDTTVTVAGTTAPDGTNTGNLLTQGTAGTALVIQAVTATADVNYSQSIWLRRGNNDWVCLRVVNGANRFQTFVNLATGALGTSSASGTGAFVGQTIEAYPNGWYRVSLAGSIGSGATSINFLMIGATADGNANPVNNATYYAWGAQFENNVSFASSYIPTAGATVTRNADVLTYPFAGNASATTGTAYAELSMLPGLDPVVSRFALTLSDSNGRLMFSAANVASTRLAMFDGTTSVQTGVLSDLSTGIRKRASSYGAAGQLITGDGVTPVSGAFDGSMGPGTGNIGIGLNASGANQWFGTLKNVSIWQTQFSAAQLQAITS